MSEWISVKDRLPDKLEPVNIVWVNREPEPYYSHIKDKPFVSTGYYHNGKWWWYSCVCEDYLAEYGCSECDSVDNGIEITHWLPLPEPPKEDPKVSAENAQLRQERDAAVRDLAYIGSCVVCKHNKDPCEREDNGHVRCFEWRGPDGRGGITV